MLILVSRSTALKTHAGDPHLGVLVTPQKGVRPWTLDLADEHGMMWACDNGCFQSLVEREFMRMLDTVRGRPRCLFVVVPDVYENAEATRRRWDDWHKVVAADSGQPLAFVTQPGCTSGMVPWDRIAALFVGGPDYWQMSVESCRLIREAKGLDKWVHIGRVGTDTRLRWAYDIGADSVDGSQYAMYPYHLRDDLGKLKMIEQQEYLFDTRA